MTTLKIKKGSYSETEEWIMKEYGSWEDHNNAADHVCAILQRENATKSPYLFITETEAETLLKSAEYQYSAGWDGWDNPKEKQWYEACMKGYINRIKKALNQHHNQVIVQPDNQVKTQSSCPVS